MPTRTPLTIETVPWDSLKPHPANPRNGDTDAIVESIKVNGVYRPIYAATDGTIIAGHHLYFALGELGHTDVDIVRLNVHPDSEQAYRIMLADNRLADRGTYDTGLLLDLLEQLKATDLGLFGTGYDPDDLDLLGQPDDVPSQDADTVNLVITGLTTPQMAAFQRLPGDDNKQRLLHALNWEDTE